ncbi:hypothetical protein D3C76_1259570 [compost metagenome]
MMTFSSNSVALCLMVSRLAAVRASNAWWARGLPSRASAIFRPYSALSFSRSSSRSSSLVLAAELRKPCPRE